MHLERRQRVFDRRDDCRRRRYRPALAGALDAERIERADSLDMDDGASRHVSRCVRTA